MTLPLIAASELIPSASPRWWDGKASVRMAFALANTMAPPTPWNTRMTMSQMAPSVPDIQVTVSSREKKVNTAKPRLYILTRPYMSPNRPKLTTSTLVTTRKPRIIHSR
jgi:hypothetical protein